MARTALIRGVRVRRPLAVTIHAVADHRRVVHYKRRVPRFIGTMARFARIG